MNRRDAIGSMLATAGAALAPNAFTQRVVHAQAGFPARTIRIVVPVAAGGGVDVFARLIADKIRALRNVSFIVENRAGGNSTIGGLEVQRAAPDGYTVLFHASTHIIARQVMRTVPYDPVADFTPIALAGQAPLVLIVANNRPEKALAEIVASAKKEPNAWSFNQFNDLNLPIIVYRGTAPAVNDVAGGHVPMMIEAILALLPMVRAGSVRAIAVTSTKRNSLAPEIPTMAEVGLPALNFGAWWGMWGPPGLPADLARTINGWVNEAVKEPAAEGRLAALGIEPAQETPQSFAQFIATDLDRSAKLLKAANFQPE
jgi:tripartite-type tricarboxylate transporter receptor subunit TctC